MYFRMRYVCACTFAANLSHTCLDSWAAGVPALDATATSVSGFGAEVASEVVFNVLPTTAGAGVEVGLSTISTECGASTTTCSATGLGVSTTSTEAGASTTVGVFGVNLSTGGGNPASGSLGVIHSALSASSSWAVALWPPFFAGATPAIVTWASLKSGSNPSSSQKIDSGQWDGRVL